MDHRCVYVSWMGLVNISLENKYFSILASTVEQDISYKEVRAVEWTSNSKVKNLIFLA